jgi:hypothetical protein
LLRASRHSVHAPIAIDAPERPGRAGVSRNISTTGMLFHSASRFKVGERLRLRFRIRPYMGEESFVEATVVRAELEPMEKHSPLPFVTAVHFAAPVQAIPADGPG